MIGRGWPSPGWTGAPPLVAVILAALVPTLAAGAQWDAVPVGSDGRVDTAAFSPVTPEHGFTWTGIGYRTTDGGDSWELLRCEFEGLEAVAELRELAFDPVDPLALWIVLEDRPFRSTDLGETWRRWGEPPPAPLSRIAPDPVTPTMIAWTVAGTGPGRGIYRTTDGGTTWHRRDPGLEGTAPESVTPSPADPALVVAATGQGVARSSDGGASWTWVRPGAEARRIHWHPAGVHASVWAGGRIVHSGDGGLTWQTGVENLSSADHDFSDLLDPTRLLSTSYTWCSTSYGWGGIASVSTNRGSTWSSEIVGGCVAPREDGPNASLEIGGDRAWVVFPRMGAGARNFRRTTDGGGSWHKAMEGIHELPTHTVEAGGDGQLWWQDPEYRWKSSSDGGATWGSPWTGRSHPWLGTNYAIGVEASRTRPGEVLIADHWSGDLSNSMTYRTTDGGQTWQESEQIYTERDGVVASNHGTGNTVYLWGGYVGHDSELWRSDDGNLTYDYIRQLPYLPADAVISPTADSIVWVAAPEGDPVRRSTDFGVTWESRSRGLPARRPVRLLANAIDPRHLLVAFEWGAPFETLDEGSTWRALPGGTTIGRADPVPDSVVLPETAELRDVRIRGAAWDVAAGGRRVFLATDRGPWVSDHGFVPAGLPIVDLDGVAYSPENELLLAWNGRHGVFGQSWPRLPSFDSPTAARSAVPAARLTVAPNPFATGSTIRFGLERAGNTRVAVHDAAGRLVADLIDGRLLAGTHSLAWDGRDRSGQRVAPGVYFVRVQTSDRTATRRVVHLR